MSEWLRMWIEVGTFEEDAAQSIAIMLMLVWVGTVVWTVGEWLKMMRA